MPLDQNQKGLIEFSIAHFFDRDAEEKPLTEIELRALVSQCRDAFNDAFPSALLCEQAKSVRAEWCRRRRPGEVEPPIVNLRDRKPDESELSYRLFICAAQPESEFRRLEVQQHVATVAEVQAYLLFYVISRLQHKIAEPAAETFDMDQWLSRFPALQDKTAFTLDWLKITKAEAELQPLQWDIKHTLTLYSEEATIKQAPFKTYSPEDHGNYHNWNLPDEPELIYKIRIVEEKPEDALQPRLDCIVDVALDEKAAPEHAVIPDFTPYGSVTASAERARVKRAAYTQGDAKALAVAIAYLAKQDITIATTTRPTSAGYDLLLYRYYFDAAKTRAIPIEKILSVEPTNFNNYRHEAVIDLLRLGFCTFDIVDLFTKEILGFISTSFYKQKILDGDIGIHEILPTSITAEQLRILNLPPVINLQTRQIISFDAARTMNRFTADILKIEFYYQAICGGRINYHDLCDLTKTQKKILAHEKIIRLIGDGQLDVVRAKQMHQNILPLLPYAAIIKFIFDNKINLEGFPTITAAQADRLDRFLTSADLRVTLLKIPYFLNLFLNNENEFYNIIGTQTCIDQLLDPDSLALLEKQVLMPTDVLRLLPHQLNLLTVPYYQNAFKNRHLSLHQLMRNTVTQCNTLAKPAVVQLQEDKIVAYDFARDMSDDAIRLLAHPVHQALYKVSSYMYETSPSKMAVDHLLNPIIITLLEQKKINLHFVATLKPHHIDVINAFGLAALLKKINSDKLFMYAISSLNEIEAEKILHPGIIKLVDHGTFTLIKAILLGSRELAILTNPGIAELLNKDYIQLKHAYHISDTTLAVINDNLIRLDTITYPNKNRNERNYFSFTFWANALARCVQIYAPNLTDAEEKGSQALQERFQHRIQQFKSIATTESLPMENITTAIIKILLEKISGQLVEKTKKTPNAPTFCLKFQRELVQAYQYETDETDTHLIYQRWRALFTSLAEQLAERLQVPANSPRFYGDAASISFAALSQRLAGWHQALEMLHPSVPEVVNTAGVNSMYYANR
jgi:hypothetical protein